MDNALYVLRCNSERIERLEPLILEPSTAPAFSQGCNSERIEREEWEAYRQLVQQGYDATQKELKVIFQVRPSTLNDSMMQLRKN
jgi:hypothetical protein